MEVAIGVVVAVDAFVGVGVDVAVAVDVFVGVSVDVAVAVLVAVAGGGTPRRTIRGSIQRASS